MADDAVRGMLRGVVHRGNGLLSESHLLWQPWLDWEYAKGDNVDAVIADRMAIPHSSESKVGRRLIAAMDATSSAYSAYLNEHQPTEYMDKMAQLTESSQSAKIKWSSEKRFGKTREDLELRLVGVRVDSS